MSRVWDRYLTDEERTHIGLRERKPVGIGERPVVLNIDNYRAVFGDEQQPLLESARLWQHTCGPYGWRALPHIQKLLAAARAAGIPVLHSTNMDEIPNWMESTRRDKDKATTADSAGEDRQRRRWHIVPEVAPLPGEVVFYKSSPSIFWGTALVAQLIHLRADTIIVAGNSTSGCVRAAVVDGATHRFRMIVAEECVFDRHQATHAMNLFDMHQKYADVLPLAEVLANLESRTRRDKAA